MILARNTQQIFYKDVQLYTKTENEKFVLYKPSGITLPEMGLSEERLPRELYIKGTDKIKGLQEVQKGFNRQLESYVKSGDLANTTKTVITIVEETLKEPRSGCLEGLSETIDILISDYARESNVVSNLLNITSTDDASVLHSINAMAFTLGVAFYVGLSLRETKILGLSALLYDVGKIKITNEILTASTKLSDKEFHEIQRHTILGHNILEDCHFEYEIIAKVALEHHEKLDGSGYPYGKKKISDGAQIIGIIDSYEALTNDDRPYRKSMPPIEALRIIKKDVDAGKFNRTLFEKFVYSLASHR